MNSIGCNGDRFITAISLKQFLAAVAFQLFVSVICIFVETQSTNDCRA